MSEQTWSFVDKWGWQEGPWNHEPDKVQWTDEATQLPCLAVRQPSLGHWCGYVGVAEGHPLFGVGYGDTPPGGSQEDAPDYVLNAHGGITYAALCREEDQPHGICHIPEPGQPEHVWWFGFDCAHAGDLSPGMLRWMDLSSGVYCGLDYVRGQCAQLAAQLAAMNKQEANE